MRPPFDLQPGETVLIARRRHPVHLYPKLAWFALILVAPIVGFVWLVSAATDLDGVVRLVVLVVCAIWGLFWAINAYFAWYRYTNDVWVVTNQRIVDSLKRHWFHHQMASADLVDVEDIAVSRSGLLGTVFNFGDVRCQTAGAQPNFVLSSIRQPTRVLAIVDAARDSAGRELVRPV